MVELRREAKRKIAEETRELREQLNALRTDSPELVGQVCNRFIETFQKFRGEDQDIIAKYLEEAVAILTGFAGKHQAELELQARQREKEDEFLELAIRVMNRYL